MKTKKDGIDIRKVKCPICGNPINWKVLDPGYSSDTLTCFICECWSGNMFDEIEDSVRHIFRLKIFNIPEVEIDYDKL